MRNLRLVLLANCSNSKASIRIFFCKARLCQQTANFLFESSLAFANSLKRATCKCQLITGVYFASVLSCLSAVRRRQQAAYLSRTFNLLTKSLHEAHTPSFVHNNVHLALKRAAVSAEAYKPRLRSCYVRFSSWPVTTSDGNSKVTSVAHSRLPWPCVCFCFWLQVANGAMQQHSRMLA